MSNDEENKGDNEYRNEWGDDMEEYKWDGP